MKQIKKIALELKQYLERSLGINFMPLILVWVIIFYAFFAQHLEAQQPDIVGFATLDDMSFLVSELRECKEVQLNNET